MPGGNSGGPVTASSLLARSEEEFRRELEDDVRQFGENGFPTLISKSNLAARLADTSPELSLKLHLEVLEGKLKSHGNKAVTGEERDAAITRDELGCCYQALGQPEKAREIRLSKGIEALICSNEPCSATAKAKRIPKLQACGQCKAIWYCSTKCQKADWKKNHKKVCKPAAAVAAAAADGGSSS
ncbi:hypothetical protein Ndes2437A_g06335 [Nannochloris sp. 'desiccata']